MLIQRMRNFPTEFQRKVLWNALTGLAIGVLGVLLVMLVMLTGKVLAYLQPVLLPVAVAGIVGYLLDPVVGWLQRKGISRFKSVVSVFAGFTMAIVMMGWIVIPPIVEQTHTLLKSDQLGANVTKTLKTWGETPWLSPAVGWALAEHKAESESVVTDTKDEVTVDEARVPAKHFGESNLAYHLTSNTEQITKYAHKFVTAGTSTILSTLGLLIGMAMVPIYLYYFLKESASIKQHWHDYVPLRASKFKTEVVDTLQEINGYLISFFRGQMLVAFIDGILVGVGLLVFGLPYALVIGIAMSVLGVIPFVGNIICLIPACVIGYIHFNIAENREHLEWMLGTNPWAYVAAVVVIFLVVQQINSLVTAPKIVGDSVGLHPMTVIFSMLFWSLLLGGFLGALMAVPLTAAVKVLFRRYVWDRQMNVVAEG